AAPGGGSHKPDNAKRDLPWKPFAEVTKDARVQTGLFTAYLKRESAYLALKPEQFDHDYLMVTELSQGIGELGIDGGSDVRSDLIRFHRSGDHVELWVVNPYATAIPNTPMARTVAYSFGQSVAQSFPIASIRDTTNEVLVDLAPFFVSDWADLGAFFQFLSQQTPMQGPGPMFDKERSSFTSLHMFPTNAEAESRLTFRTARSFGLDMVPDYRWIPVGVHYSILELPATPMRPRYADDRVGYFVSAMKNFSRDTAESFFVRYVNRWRLEKKDPSAAVSDPVKPITYYLDRTIPFEWRPYVRDGILEWNRAFEEAGIRNAIQVLDAPDDSLWSAEDARYSTVRWMANNAFTYAIGPSDVDPRTGEILNADILIAASWIQAWQGEYRDYAGPQAMIREVFLEDSLLRADPNGRRFQRLCSYGASIAHHRDIRPLGDPLWLRCGRWRNARCRTGGPARHRCPGIRARPPVRHGRGRRVRCLRPRSHRDALRPDVRPARLGQGPRDAREPFVRLAGNAARGGRRRLPQAAARLPGPAVRALVRDARHHQVP